MLDEDLTNGITEDEARDFCDMVQSAYLASRKHYRREIDQLLQTIETGSLDQIKAAAETLKKIIY